MSMGVEVAKVGRKRRDRTTYLGRSARREEGRELAAKQPHRIWLPEAFRTHEKAADALGCLNLLGHITDEQHEAGRLYGNVVCEYRVAICVPSTGGSGGKGYPCKGDPRCGQLEDAPPCECRARKDKYNRAFEALATAGHKASVAVARVAVHGEMCPPGMLRHLLCGLDSLRRHFGLDGPRRKMQAGKTSLGNAP